MIQLRRNKNFLFTAPCKSAMPYIYLCIPDITIIFNHSKSCLIFCSCCFFNSLNSFIYFLYFCQLPIVTIIIIQDSMPINLCSKRAGSPTEKTHIICSMCNALHCPKHHLPWFRCRCFHSGIPSIRT